MPAVGFITIYGFVQLDSPNGDLPLSVDPAGILTVGNDLNRKEFQLEPAEGENMYWIKSFNGQQYVKMAAGILILGDSPFSWYIVPVDRAHRDIFYVSESDSSDTEFWTMEDTDDGSPIMAKTKNSSVNRKQRWKFKPADGPKLEIQP